MARKHSGKQKAGVFSGRPRKMEARVMARPSRKSLALIIEKHEGKSAAKALGLLAKGETEKAAWAEKKPGRVINGIAVKNACNAAGIIGRRNAKKRAEIHKWMQASSNAFRAGDIAKGAACAEMAERLVGKKKSSVFLAVYMGTIARAFPKELAEWFGCGGDK